MKCVVAVLLCVAGLSGVASAGDFMQFENKNGTVVFDHNKHQELAQRDCTVCHERPGAIKGFGRSFAHRVCIGCHEPEVGKMEGPITCDGCHAPRS